MNELRSTGLKKQLRTLLIIANFYRMKKQISKHQIEITTAVFLIIFACYFISGECLYYNFEFSGLWPLTNTVFEKPSQTVGLEHEPADSIWAGAGFCLELFVYCPN